MRVRAFTRWLLIGVIISILVAWLCMLSPGGNGTVRGEGIKSIKTPPLGVSDYDSINIEIRGYGWDRHSNDARRGDRYRVDIAWRAGWPFRALWAEHRGEHEKATIADAELGIPLRPWTGLPLRWLGIAWFQVEWSSRRLPLVPLPGLALDAVFWGGLAWMMIRGPRHVRGAYRRRHGRCVACAYPVGASDVCTECGNPRLIDR